MIERLAAITSSNGCERASTVPLLVHGVGCDRDKIFHQGDDGRRWERMPELDIIAELFTVAPPQLIPRTSFLALKFLSH
jgi:hypothetical protein